MVRLVLLLSTLFFSLSTMAHHSISVLFDYTNIIQREATVKKINWVNPHITIEFEYANDAGKVEEWVAVGSAVNLLKRLGVSREQLKAGDQIIIKGAAARKAPNLMLAALILLPDGRQVALFPGSAKRAGLIESNPVKDVFKPENLAKIAPNKALGLFRVWTPREKPNTDSGLGIPPWPLTDYAKEAQASFDPLTDDPALSCVQAGMPVVLDTPYPVEFLEQGEDIVMKIEEWDVVRIIHMNAEEKAPVKVAASPWGYATGRWDGDALTVVTKNINYPYFDDLGTPQTDAVVITERYWLSDDGNVLYWSGTGDDPKIFTEKAKFEGNMVWVPGEEIKPFNCTLTK